MNQLGMLLIAYAVNNYYRKTISEDEEENQHEEIELESNANHDTDQTEITDIEKLENFVDLSLNVETEPESPLISSKDPVTTTRRKKTTEKGTQTRDEKAKRVMKLQAVYN